ncbi:MAG: polysaccharide deacetylase family protein [Gammaproteobacteria bacterium]|nr:polysaccharide deacetylase family protein [Gammaproteobacteria bacterium]
MSRNPFIEQAWHWLGEELELWAEAGQNAQFWWRDDDACDSGAALERLLHIGQSSQTPLALAVIPSALKPGLVEALQLHKTVCVLQHGYAHNSHAAPGQRKIELGGRRSHEQILDDLALGRLLLEQNFQGRFVAALVPPWNRIDSDIVERLPELGFCGISTMKKRASAHPVPALLQVNTHLDPINWRHDSGFIGVYPAIAILIQHLVAKRQGYRDSAEATGILSHHLVQNESVWRFLDDLLRFLSQHPAADFIDARQIWRNSD